LESIVLFFCADFVMDSFVSAGCVADRCSFPLIFLKFMSGLSLDTTASTLGRQPGRGGFFFLIDRCSHDSALSISHGSDKAVTSISLGSDQVASSVVSLPVQRRLWPA
jgi:hypothetical protein